MSELPSALFSIADGSEFRFTRFYIVCEAVPLGAPESPLIVCGLPDTPQGTVQTWKDTEFDVRRGTEEILGFYSKECRCRLHLELIVFSLSPYKTYAVLCFRNPAVIFGRGYMPDKLVKHAATVYNRGN